MYCFSSESFPFWGVIVVNLASRPPQVLQHIYVDGKYAKMLFLSHNWISLVKSSNIGISCASEVPRLISIGMLSTSDNYVVRTKDFLRSSSNSWTQTSVMLVRPELDVMLLSENHQLFAKIARKRLFWSYELIFYLKLN